MSGDTIVLLIPATPLIAAALLSLIPNYRIGAGINIVACLLTFGLGLSLLDNRPQPGLFLHVDDFNIYLISLTAFVAFTTAIFSATYISHELAIGRLTPVYLRFYHAMYQMLLFAMMVALSANNIGVMWVAIELATLTTVLMVGIYRTHEALDRKSVV